MNNDLISRSALMKRLKDWRNTHNYQDDSALCATLDTVLLAIDDAPAVDAEPVRRGEWENGSNRTSKTYLRRCTACGRECYFCGTGCSYNYCPNCGAKMDGGAKNAAD